MSREFALRVVGENNPRYKGSDAGEMNSAASELLREKAQYQLETFQRYKRDALVLDTKSRVGLMLAMTALRFYAKYEELNSLADTLEDSSGSEVLLEFSPIGLDANAHSNSTLVVEVTEQEEPND